MGRLITLAAAIAIGLAAAAWYYQPARRAVETPAPPPESEDAWLTRLYSQNPKEAAGATRRLRNFHQLTGPGLWL